MITSKTNTSLQWPDASTGNSKVRIEDFPSLHWCCMTIASILLDKNEKQDTWLGPRVMSVTESLDTSGWRGKDKYYLSFNAHDNQLISWISNQITIHHSQSCSLSLINSRALLLDLVCSCCHRWMTCFILNWPFYCICSRSINLFDAVLNNNKYSEYVGITFVTVSM